MLPEHAWRPWEPRFGFPVFRDFTSLVSFSIRPDFTPFKASRLPGQAKWALKRGASGVKDFLVEYGAMLVDRDLRRNVRFRMVITTRRGEFLRAQPLPGSYPAGGSIDVNVSELIRTLGLPEDDYMAILVMSRGRPDGFRSSPGSYSMTYFNETSYSTYRTGGFARTLNEPNVKSHRGFRGINPKAIADQRRVSSILLINHSSNPLYDATVEPRSVLLRADGATREASFGVIAPFGGVERTMEELFGADVVDFLAPSGGKGTVITTCPGVTLASIHVMRARDGSSFSIEHSRPTHTYLNGIG